MNANELKLLEKAFSAEVNGALSKNGLYMIQTNSKLAEKLVADGLLRKDRQRPSGNWPCTVEGYVLTDAGRLAYCTHCL